MEEETLSLHNYITFDVELGVARSVEQRAGRIDEEAFARLLTEELANCGVNLDFLGLRKAVQNACKGATPIIITNQNAHDAYWWTLQIQEARVATLRARRQVTGLSGRNGIDDAKLERVKIAYKEEKKTLRRLIRKEKRECWRKSCKDVDNDI